MVPFGSYNDHVARCLRATRIIGFLRRHAGEQGGSSGDEEESNETHESEIADMSRHFTRNAQVSRMSLHDFISNHFSGVSSPPARNIVWFNISGIQGAGTGTGTYESNTRLGERMGRVEVGLNEDQLREVCYSSNDIDELVVEKDDVCPICQENLAGVMRDGGAACMLACGHMYCDGCIKQWLSAHKKCPVCMVDLEDAYCWGR